MRIFNKNAVRSQVNGKIDWLEFIIHCRKLLEIQKAHKNRRWKH